MRNRSVNMKNVKDFSSRVFCRNILHNISDQFLQYQRFKGLQPSINLMDLI